MYRSIFIALTICLLTFGCDRQPPGGASDSGGNPSKVTLQLNWKPEPQFGGFYAAQVIEAYKKHGLDVDVTPGGAGAPTIQMIGAGTVPFGIVSADQIVIARANGNKVKALFAVYQTNPQGIMTRADRKFSTLADIFTHEGTLAMERGLPYSNFLEKKFGFAKLKIVPSPFGDLSVYRTEANYAMQCFITSEPLAAKTIGIEPKAFLIAESGYNPYTTVLATSDDYLSAHPATVRAMAAAVREGWQAYLSDPAKTNDLMNKLNPTMDRETFVESAEAQKPLILRDDPTGGDVGTMSLDRWKQLVEQLTDLKAISKPVAPEDCFVDLSKP